MSPTDKPTEPRADDPGALVEYPYPCLCCDELTAAKAELVRLAEQLRQMTQMRDHAQDTLQDITAGLAEQLAAAHAEAAALRPVMEAARHYIACEDDWIKSGMGGVAAKDADSAANRLRKALAALAPPEPRCE